MAVISDAIVGGIAWEAFSKSISFYAEGVNDFALRLYIANELRALDALDGVSDKQMDEAIDIIEAEILATPEEIKQITEPQKQKESFEKYFNEKPSIKNIVNGTLQGVQHNEGTVHMHFGDVHNHPNQ